MTVAFFSGEQGRDNIVYMLRFFYSHKWKERYECPELVPYDSVIKPAIGIGIYPALHIQEDPEALMRIAFPDYGILTLEKQRLIDEKYKSMAPRQKWLVNQRFRTTSSTSS